MPQCVLCASFSVLECDTPSRDSSYSPEIWRLLVAFLQKKENNPDTVGTTQMLIVILWVGPREQGQAHHSVKDRPRRASSTSSSAFYRVPQLEPHFKAYGGDSYTLEHPSVNPPKAFIATPKVALSLGPARHAPHHLMQCAMNGAHLSVCASPRLAAWPHPHPRLETWGTIRKMCCTVNKRTGLYCIVLK